jgi:hypothetical protein
VWLCDRLSVWQGRRHRLGSRDQARAAVSMRAAGKDSGSVWGVVVGGSETSPTAGGHLHGILHVPWRVLGKPRGRKERLALLPRAAADPQPHHHLSTRPRANLSTDARTLIHARLGGRAYGTGLPLTSGCGQRLFETFARASAALSRAVARIIRPLFHRRLGLRKLSLSRSRARRLDWRVNAACPPRSSTCTDPRATRPLSPCSSSKNLRRRLRCTPRTSVR